MKGKVVIEMNESGGFSVVIGSSRRPRHEGQTFEDAVVEVNRAMQLSLEIDSNQLMQGDKRDPQEVFLWSKVPKESFAKMVKILTQEEWVVLMHHGNHVRFQLLRAET